MSKDQQSYESRNELLRHLGFASYNEYLVSTLWKSIRARAFDLHGRMCWLCGGEATQIHHIGYGRDVLLGNDLSGLVPLCEPCHERVEYRNGGDGRKRSLKDSQTAYYQLKRKANKMDHSKLIGRCVECKSNKAVVGANHCRPCAEKLGVGLPRKRKMTVGKLIGLSWKDYHTGKLSRSPHTLVASLVSNKVSKVRYTCPKCNKPRKKNREFCKLCSPLA